MWPTKFKAKIERRGIKAEMIFYVGYFAFLIGATISYSVVAVPFMNFIKYLGLGIMFLYMLYANRRSSWKIWLLLISAYLVTLIIVHVSGTRLFLEILVFITAFKDIDFNKFIKRDFLLRLGIVLVVVGLGAIGVLDSTIRSREDGILRYALGFNHPNLLGLQVIFLSLEFVYLNRNRKNLWSIVVVFAALLFNYKITNSRTAMIVSIMLLPFLLIPKRMYTKIFSNKFVGLIMKASFVIFLVLALALCFWYTKDNTILLSINNAFSYRLSLGHSYLFDYGILEPFGNNLTSLEATILGLPKSTGKPIDIGYLHVLIRFGWIVILVWAIAYWRAMSFMQKNRNWTGMMILLVISFYSMFETGTLFGSVDPFLPFFSVLFYGYISGLRTKTSKAKNDILLLTWAEGDNYGTALQSWCLKQVINNFAYFMPSSGLSRREVNVLNYHVMMNPAPNEFENRLLGKVKRFRQRSLEQNKVRLKYHIRKLRLSSKLHQREQLFQEFRQNEFDLFPGYTIDRRSELAKLPNFKTYLIGSDQVWNPKLLDTTFLLDWAPKNSVKISYAPSVCVELINKDELSEYAPLKNFSMLSVRENTFAVKEISRFVDKKIIEVVDPVILYGREALMRHCHIDKINNYCLTYILGSSIQSREYAMRFAQNNKLRLLSVTGVNKLNLLADEILDDSAVWNLPPLGIIDLVFNSKIVITDSFHILVLCVLLHKQFIILPREGGKSQQNNRIITFLKSINMENLFGYAPDNIESLRFLSYGWALSDTLIDEQRRKSFEYLMKALKVGNNEKADNNIGEDYIHQKDEKKVIHVDYADEKTEVKIQVINKFRKKNDKRKREKKIDIIINGQRKQQSSKRKRIIEDIKNGKQ